MCTADHQLLWLVSESALGERVPCKSALSESELENRVQCKSVISKSELKKGAV